MYRKNVENNNAKNNKQKRKNTKKKGKMMVENIKKQKGRYGYGGNQDWEI